MSPHKKSKTKKSKNELNEKIKKKMKNEKKKLKKKIKKEKKEKLKESVNEELLKKSKSMAPMTKEEWVKRQSVVRRIYDESTGRSRLIKGDGEVLEEIVSKDRHKQINQQATKGDGKFFQSKLSGFIKK